MSEIDQHAEPVHFLDGNPPALSDATPVGWCFNQCPRGVSDQSGVCEDVVAVVCQSSVPNSEGVEESWVEIAICAS